MSTHVSVDNFVRAETDRMFAGLQRDAGGVNRFAHNREPSPIDHQTVIRMNRDTLYSFAVVDISAGATVTIPDHGNRYLSVMVVNNDHFINGILHDPGTYSLTTAAHHTDHVLVAARTLVDPAMPGDLDAVAAIQDGLVITAASARPFVLPDYDTASFDATRNGLLALAATLQGFNAMFGRRDEVDPVRHLIGSAAGWGGLPTSEASYVGVFPQGSGNQELVMRDVPVDAFWSVSVYNAEGYFEPNERNAYSVNSITAVPDADGAVTVRFGDYPAGTPNAIPAPEGWNLIVRLYRPRAEVLDGTWTVPNLRPAS